MSPWYVSLGPRVWVGHGVLVFVLRRAASHEVVLLTTLQAATCFKIAWKLPLKKQLLPSLLGLLLPEALSFLCSKGALLIFACLLFCFKARFDRRPRLTSNLKQSSSLSRLCSGIAVPGLNGLPLLWQPTGSVWAVANRPFLYFQLTFFLSHVHKAASESHYPESPKGKAGWCHFDKQQYLGMWALLQSSL